MILNPIAKRNLMEVHETDANYVATMELPGVDKQDITVDMEHTTLVVRINSKTQNRFSGVTSKLKLPPQIIPDTIEANYNNGVLEMRIPKTQSQKRRIQIK